MDPPDPDPQHCFLYIYSRLTQQLFRWCPHTDSSAAAAAVRPVRRTAPHQLQHVQEEVAQGEAAGQAGPHSRQRHRGDHHHRRRESRRCDEKVQTRLVWCGFGCFFRIMWSSLLFSLSWLAVLCQLNWKLYLFQVRGILWHKAYGNVLFTFVFFCQALNYFLRGKMFFFRRKGGQNILVPIAVYLRIQASYLPPRF